MSRFFPSDQELGVLAQQVDDQLAILRIQTKAEVHVRSAEQKKCDQLSLAREQQTLIENATGEPFERFWGKFKRHARNDLCLPTGLLYRQWLKWRDLQSKDSVKVAFGALAGMGIPTASIAPIAVAASVFLLTVVANIGIQAVCEDCDEEDAEIAKPHQENQRKK